jgi:CxxC motif-containing protein (DUF1111 family)
MRVLLVALAICIPPASLWAAAVIGDEGYATHDRSRLALSNPAPVLDERQRAAFAEGRAIFDQPWLVAPSMAQPAFAGLGPLYNQLSCAGCHLHDGRGDMPDASGVPLHAAIVRLSVRDARGVHADPVYGLQLQTEGIPGVPPEGRATVDWQASTQVLADGTAVPMRAPRLRLERLHYGPLAAGSMTSLRLAPALVGMGLLEAIPVDDVVAQAVAERADPDGVRGQPNWVRDVQTGRVALGRLGLKANQPGVRQQVETALYEDMGITSEAFPVQNCSAAEQACRLAPGGGQPEATRQQIDALVAYVDGLAVPARVHADAPAVRTGERLFARLGCAECHRPTWHTGRFPAFTALSDQEIHPYTDLLLHDMGPGLADGRPDGRANGRQWRTAPLWGLGLAGVVAGDARYLHDGRARSLPEAILWHGGEAAAARERYRRLDADERAELAAFLESL